MSVYCVSILERPSDLYAAAMGDDEPFIDWLYTTIRDEGYHPTHDDICKWIDAQHPAGTYIEVRRLSSGKHSLAFGSPGFTETTALDDVGEVVASTQEVDA